jgi:hypothetical protein
MEITQTEFVKAMNHFMDKEEFEYTYFANGDGLVNEDKQWVLLKQGRDFQCYNEAKDFIKNELRQPKAKVIDKWGNGAFKLYELSESIGKYHKIVKAPVCQLFGITDEGLWNKLKHEDRNTFWEDYKID